MGADTVFRGYTFRRLQVLDLELDPDVREVAGDLGSLSIAMWDRRLVHEFVRGL
jgi:hypothetical protein